MGEMMKTREILQVFSSFQEAEKADHEFYAAASPQERLNILLELIARHRESTGEAAKGFERVYRVTELVPG